MHETSRFNLVFLERCTDPDYAIAVKECPAFIRHKFATPSPSYLRHQDIKLSSILQFPRRYVVIKPKVPHMVFNIGESVAEATNFFLENHIHLLNDVRRGKDVLYKYLVCKCEDGKGTVPHVRKVSLKKISNMSFANRRDKRSAGKQKLSRAKKKRSARFTHFKVS